MEFNITKNGCKCGKEHFFNSEILVGKGVIDCIPTLLNGWSAKKAFIYADLNTYAAAGKKVSMDLLLQRHQ